MLPIETLSDKQSPVDRVEASYREHRDSIRRYLLRRTRDHHEAEELTQRVFVDAAKALSNPACEPESMLAWLYAIADRRLVDELRRRARASSHVRRLSSSSVSPDALEYGGDLVGAIRGAVSNLPPDQRKVVVMKVFEGRSFAEIASVSGASEAACKMRFSRAIRQVRASLDDQGHAP